MILKGPSYVCSKGPVLCLFILTCVTWCKLLGTFVGGVRWLDVCMAGCAAFARRESNRPCSCLEFRGGPGSPTMSPGMMGLVPRANSAEVACRSSWYAVLRPNSTQGRRPIQFSPASSAIWCRLALIPSLRSLCFRSTPPNELGWYGGCRRPQYPNCGAGLSTVGQQRCSRCQM